MGPEGCLLIWTLSHAENHYPGQKAQGRESSFPREPGLGSRHTGNAVRVLWDMGTVVGDTGSSAPSQGLQLGPAQLMLHGDGRRCRVGARGGEGEGHKQPGGCFPPS